MTIEAQCFYGQSWPHFSTRILILYSYNKKN